MLAPWAFTFKMPSCSGESEDKTEEQLHKGQRHKRKGEGALSLRMP